MFDPKYKTIIEIKHRLDYLDMLDWVNKNSIGSVDAKFENESTADTIYLGFEDAADALVFSIRYSM